MEKSSRIELRVTPEEKDAWTLAAGGRKLSSWLRELANEAAKPTDPASLVYGGEKSDDAWEKFTVSQPAPTKRNCPRLMHHRKGVYCGACSKVV